MDNAHYERRIPTVCLLILTAIAIGMALYFLRPVLIPFVLAVFLVFCLVPAIDVQLRHLQITRPLAVLNTILVGSFILALIWLLVWASVSQMVANTPQYEAQFRQLLDKLVAGLPLDRFGLEADELGSILQFPQESARGLLTLLASSIMSVLSNGLLVIIFMIFLLAGTGTRDQPAGGLWGQVESRIKRYVLTKAIVSATTGTLVGLTLWIFGVELALVFGVLAFLLNFIPNIGSVIATLLPVPVILLSPSMSPVAKVLAIAIPGTIQLVVGTILEPKIMGKSLDLHPVVVLLGLIFFGMIWGIVGMILATPIVAVLKIVLERIDVTAPVGNLLEGRLRSSAHDT